MYSRMCHIDFCAFLGNLSVWTWFAESIFLQAYLPNNWLLVSADSVFVIFLVHGLISYNYILIYSHFADDIKLTELFVSY